MPRTKSVETADRQPVLHTPRGASPRGLRSDAFVVRPTVAPPSADPGPEQDEERTSAAPGTGEQPSNGPRDWEFAMPEPIRQERDPLLDPDANWRQHAGLRAPLETVPLPVLARERFSENWQRLAREPRPDRPHGLRRKLEKSRLTRWMFSHGRLELGAAAGLLLLVVLLIAAFIYGWRLLAGPG